MTALAIVGRRYAPWPTDDNTLQARRAAARCVTTGDWSKDMDTDDKIARAFTLRDVCGLLQTTDTIVLGLIARGELRAYSVGDEWRVDSIDLQAYRDHAKQGARTRRLPQARVVAIASMKGGVGRTTTAFALGHAMAFQGARVLLIDGDPQASLTIVAGFDPRHMEHAVRGLAVRQIMGASTSATGRVIVGLYDRLDLVPMAHPLSVSDLGLGLVESYIQVVEPVLGDLRERYDVILVDYPPVRALPILAGLTIADEILIPVAPDRLSLEALVDFESLLLSIGQIYRKTLAHAGIVFTLVSRGALQHEMVQWAIALTHGHGEVLGSIPLSRVVAAAADAKQPITVYDPTHRVSQAYAAVARRLMERWQLPIIAPDQVSERGGQAVRHGDGENPV